MRSSGVSQDIPVSAGSAMECGAILDALRILRLGGPQDVQDAKLLVERVEAMLTKMCR